MSLPLHFLILDKNQKLIIFLSIFKGGKAQFLGDRSVVGHMALDHGTGVRIPVPQPERQYIVNG
jgi:hypothetical protein